MVYDASKSSYHRTMGAARRAAKRAVQGDGKTRYINAFADRGAHQYEVSEAPIRFLETVTQQGLPAAAAKETKS
jgi:hypothetical protein